MQLALWYSAETNAGPLEEEQKLLKAKPSLSAWNFLINTKYCTDNILFSVHYLEHATKKINVSSPHNTDIYQIKHEKKIKGLSSLCYCSRFSNVFQQQRFSSGFSFHVYWVNPWTFLSSKPALHIKFFPHLFIEPSGIHIGFSIDRAVLCYDEEFTNPVFEVALQ